MAGTMLAWLQEVSTGNKNIKGIYDTNGIKGILCIWCYKVNIIRDMVVICYGQACNMLRF